jgi:hypothetical protein
MYGGGMNKEDFKLLFEMIGTFFVVALVAYFIAIILGIN